MKTRLEIEGFFRSALEKKLLDHGYELDHNLIFHKKYNEDVSWFFSASLWNNKPYSISSSIGCEYVNATLAMKKFIERSGGVFESFAKVSFAVELDRYAKTKHAMKIASESDVESVVEIFSRKVKETEDLFLISRVEQKNVVEEYFKPVVKWPSGDLMKCCVTILSYALLVSDADLFKRGLDRVFEIINRPNYSQRHREFFEFLKTASK